MGTKTSTGSYRAGAREGVFGRAFRALVSGAYSSLALVIALPTAWAETPITLLDRYVGHTNYVATGGSFRTQPNTVNACAVSPTSSATLTGLPPGATIRAVYLYWVGSGNVDSQVTLNGTTVSAERTDTAVFNFNGTAYDFFTGFAEISNQNIVTANGNLTLSDLNFATGIPYCPVQVVTGGWSLYVVYDEPSEPLHAVNIFDGFQFFRGSSINLTASGFRIPPNFVSGRFTFSHFDGDPQNSTAVNGFAELLSLNGNPLDDGIVAPASNPTQQPYDGTINGAGVSNSHGVDVDTYDVTSLLSPGDTAATVTMSAGGDLVLSTGMIIAVNTEPVSDLAITSSQSGPYAPSLSATVSAIVSNNGPEDDANEIRVTTTLPAGLTYQSASGGSWSCVNNPPDLLCTHPGALATGASLAPLDLLVRVETSAPASLDVPFTVDSDSLDTEPSNDTTTEAVTVVRPDLSTSSKLVADPNGGDAVPGEPLRYTIRVTNSGPVEATGVSVTDDLPLFVESLQIITLPAGSTNNSTAIGGSNGNGFIDVSGFSVAAGATEDLVFDVIIGASAQPGDVISNTATIDQPNGPGANPLAPNVIVLASQVSASGTKTLYLYDTTSSDPNGFDNGSAPYLSRTPPTSTLGNVPVDKTQPPISWRLTPALRTDLTLDAGSIPITLFLSKGGGGGSAVQRELRVTLAVDGVTLGASQTQIFAAPPSANPLELTFSVPLAAQQTLPAGSTLTLTLENLTAGGGNRRIRVFPTSGGQNSRIDLAALTVINVDSLELFDQPAPAGDALVNANPAQAISVRAQVSDPFGSFDIASASLRVLEPGGSSVAALVMNRIADSGLANASFEAIYAIPADATPGIWQFEVTAVEGVEGIVTHSRSTTLTVLPPPPALTLTKTVATESDPISGTSNPFNIPGAITVYTLQLINSGAGSPDPGTLRLHDVIPDDTVFVVSGPGDPVSFQEDAVPSGLTFNFASDVRFSNQADGRAPFDYTPADIGNGTDPAVRGIEIIPSGTMAPAAGSGSPGFLIRFRVQVTP